LLETTRAYAAEKLAESGEGSTLAAQHARHNRELMKVAEIDWETKQQDRWMGLYAGRIVTFVPHSIGVSRRKVMSRSASLSLPPQHCFGSLYR
jgi:predicted ATPase